jgi:cholest-4-en-3-one 26-monooxygenase
MSIDDIDLLDLDRFARGEQHEMFRRLRLESPVHWHEHPEGRGFWNVMKHADLTAVNRNSTLFSSEMGGIGLLDPQERDPAAQSELRSAGVSMISTDPPRHTRYRMLISKGFTPRMVQLLEEVMRQRCIVIVDEIIERGECDFVVDVAAELPLQTIAEIMGVPIEHRGKIFDWSNRFVGVDDPEYAADVPLPVVEGQLRDYANALAEERRRDPRDDIVTKLVEAEIDGERLTELEYGSFMSLLAVAGNETTRNTTSWGMHLLATHPDAYALLREHIDDDSFVNTAVDEMLRFASPVLQFRRTATADTEIRGREIKRGDKVVIWFASANRDEDVFDDPFRFDITRTPNPHVAFGGGGVHYCLGASLARTQLRLLFREIVTRIPDMRCVGEVSLLRSNRIGGIKHMPVRFTPGHRVLPAS